MNSDMFVFRTALVFSIAVFAFSAVSFGQEVEGENNYFEEAESNMKDLLEKLESPRFAERRAATTRLQQLGALAHGVLERIAVSGEAETSSRALELLKQATKDKDPGIKSSAREALKRIAESDAPQARAAERALRVPKQARNFPPIPQPVLPRVPFQFAPVPMQPPAFGGGGQNNLRISIRSVNGVRSIEVVQNNQTFRFRDVAGGIEVERPNDKGGIKKQKYKSALEMQKADPEVYGIYQKAGGDRAGKAIRGMMRMLPPGGIGPGIPVLPRQPQIQNPKALPQPPGQPQQPGPRLQMFPDFRPVPAPIPNAKPKTKSDRIDV